MISTIISYYSNRPIAKRLVLLPGFFVCVMALCFGVRAWLGTSTSAGASSPGAPVTSNVFSAQVPGQAKQGAVYVKRGQLWPELMPMLDVLGSRLEERGKERLLLIGTIVRPAKDGQVKVPVRLFLERPGRARLEQQVGNRTQVTIFDPQSGNDANKDGAVPALNEENELETLIFDSIDRFMLSRMDEQATRFLGSRFRLDDGKAANYTGPYYELFQVFDNVGVVKGERLQPKLFFFNSKTQLLELVRYESTRDTTKTKVEVRLENWQPFSGQPLPAKLTRSENGTQVMTLEVSNVVIGPSQPDGIFGRI